MAGAVDWGLLALWFGIVGGVTYWLWAAGLIILNMPIALIIASAALLLAVIVFALLEALGKHQTLGKHLLKLQLGTTHGKPPGFIRSLLRNLIKIALPLVFVALSVLVLRASLSWDNLLVATVALAFPALYLLGIWFTRKTLYDIITDTRVLPMLGRRAIIDDDFEPDDDDPEAEETVILPRRAIQVLKADVAADS